MKRFDMKNACPVKGLKVLSRSRALSRARKLRKEGWDARFLSVEGVGSVLAKKRTPDLPGWALATAGVLLALLVLRRPGA